MFGSNYNTIREYKAVSERFKFDERSSNLEWSHHQAVAYEPSAIRAILLADAEPEAADKTFEEYCKERWGMVRQHCNRLIAAAEIAKNLEPTGSKPSCERHARPLTKLPESEQAEAWREAVDKSEDGEPTAKAASLGIPAVNAAVECNLLAERKAGAMLAGMEIKAGRPKENGSTLEPLGIDKKQSHRWQRIASVPEDVCFISPRASIVDPGANGRGFLTKGE